MEPRKKNNCRVKYAALKQDFLKHKSAQRYLKQEVKTKMEQIINNQCSDTKAQRLKMGFLRDKKRPFKMDCRK